MQYIYARVSTGLQDSANQVTSLTAAYPNAVVFQETASGAKERPVLQALLDNILKKDDVLIVAALDRLGRRTSEVLALIETLEKRGVILKSIREGVDYSTIAGRLVTQILVSVAEMERALIGERTRMALQTKKAQGVRLGRPPVIPAEKVAEIRRLRAEGLTVRAVAKLTGVSHTHVAKLSREAAA